jgi:hypothetical protein
MFFFISYLKKNFFFFYIFLKKVKNLLTNNILFIPKTALHNFPITFENDGLVSSFRLPFEKDLIFKKVITKTSKIINKVIYDEWRQYVYTAYFINSLRKSDNNNEIFLEVGIGVGARNLITLNYLKAKKIRMLNKLYAFDSFAGINPDLITKKEYLFKKKFINQKKSEIAEDYYKNAISKNYNYNFVKKTFKSFNNVRIIKGWVPEILYKNQKIFKKNSIIFAHIDLNSAEAEKQCLEFIFPYMNKNGVIIFDDYLFQAHNIEIFKKINNFCDKKKIPRPIGLPTGQGLMVCFR